jgi:hypothetical protein
MQTIVTVAGDSQPCIAGTLRPVSALLKELHAPHLLIGSNEIQLFTSCIF